MRLHTAGKAIGIRRPIVARVSLSEVPLNERRHTAIVAPTVTALPSDLRGYAAVLLQESISDVSKFSKLVHSVREIDHLSTGHIVAIEPLNGFVRTLYRPESRHNNMFVTERCNSNCLMCSQPPSDKDDVEALTERNLALIELMAPAPEYLCITGGEPTLLGDKLFQIITQLREKLPSTYVHMLTNGRRFAWPAFTASLAAINHPDFSVGVPLYSDDARIHDYVVQARGAFDQTVLGLHQLARYGVEIELRIVLHAVTVQRLVRLAEYVRTNLTFVDHVSFMAMEHIGYAPRNMSDLWIDPADYQDVLEGSITTLARFGIESRIYNLQLCVLKPSLRGFAKQSISDWKNSYDHVCESCAARQQCCGFFHWNTSFQSRGIHAL